MVQFLSIKLFFLDFFNFCWVFQKFPFFCVTLYKKAGCMLDSEKSGELEISVLQAVHFIRTVFVESHTVDGSELLLSVQL